MKGRRRPDVSFGTLPEDLEPSDYWKYVDADGEALSARAYAAGGDPDSKVHGNLEDTMWGFEAPNGAGLGLLVYHTVREHENGSITVRPSDGSTNSILHHGHIEGADVTWHGYVYEGEWKPC